MNFEFSEKTKKALLRSGWFENRQVNLEVEPMFIRLVSEFALATQAIIYKTVVGFDDGDYLELN